MCGALSAMVLKARRLLPLNSKNTRKADSKLPGPLRGSIERALKGTPKGPLNGPLERPLTRMLNETRKTLNLTKH